MHIEYPTVLLLELHGLQAYVLLDYAVNILYPQATERRITGRLNMILHNGKSKYVVLNMLEEL